MGAYGGLGRLMPFGVGWVVYKQFSGFRGELQGRFLNRFELFFEQFSVPDDVSGCLKSFFRLKAL